MAVVDASPRGALANLCSRRARRLNGGGREPVGVHDLRHSFVAVALAARLTLPEAAALARHANPRVAATVYAGLTDAPRAGLEAKLAEAFGA
jgi:integrase